VLPNLPSAADLIAEPQVRNRGTIGGSAGNADPAATAGVVIAVNAKLEIAGRPAADISLQTLLVDIMTTALEPAEVLVAIHIPRPNPGTQFRIARSAIRRRLCRGRCRRSRCACKTASLSEASIGITGATAGLRGGSRERASDRQTTSSQNIACRIAASEQAECLSDGYASADYRKHLVKTEVTRALASLSDA